MATNPITKEPRSNLEWRFCGALDIGVSHDYSSGLAEWEILRDHLAHYGLSRWEVGCEIGCGAGRMTNAVAQHFAKVHGLDVAKERLAQAHAAPNASRCTFHAIREPAIPLPSESCDLVFSIHVFQHLSGGAAETYFREAHRVLRRGGVMMVHLPVVGAHGLTGDMGERARRGAIAALRAVGTATVRLATRLGLGGALAAAARRWVRSAGEKVSAPVSQFRVFSFARVADLLVRLGFERVELRVLPVRDHNSYVFARKP
jgi:SAM-dependent methyltransferase